MSGDQGWRANQGRNHRGRINYCMLNGVGSDVTFLVGPSKESIKAHKLFFSIASPVFEKMFTELKTETLEIPDISPEIFRLLEKYIYLGEWNSQDPKQAIPLLSAAKTYEIPDLVNACGKVLKSAINPKTALVIYKQAVKFAEKDLEKAAEKTICEFAHEVVEENDFLDLDLEHLLKLLPLDDLAVENEIQLFKAVIRWTEAKLGAVFSKDTRREMMRDLNPFIRYPTMERNDFAVKVNPLEVLDLKDSLSIGFSFGVIDLLEKSKSVGDSFNCNPRKYYTPK